MPKNKTDYIAKYNKQNYKMYQFRVKKSDTDLIEQLDLVQDRNQYIINLIKADIGTRVLTFDEIVERIRPVAEKHKIKELYIFGSYARGEATRKSDVDIYCDSGNTNSLWELSELKDDFKTSLVKEVDIVVIGSEMDDIFREQLDNDKIRII